MTTEQRRQHLEVLFELLKAGVVLASAVVAPNAVQIFAPLFREKRHLSEKEAKDTILYAHKAGWVEAQRRGQRSVLVLTPRGKKRADRVAFWRGGPHPQQNWDGRWRILFFDVPEKRKDARDAVRAYLRRWGFLQVQKSVWLTPWPCDEHVQALREWYVLYPHLRLAQVYSFDGEEEFLRKFDLERIEK